MVLNVLLPSIPRELSVEIVVCELHFSFRPSTGVTVAESHIIDDLAQVLVFVEAI
jgi:hypothetical protein